MITVGPLSYSGEWDFNDPTVFKHEETQTPVTLKGVGKGIEVATRGSRLIIGAGRTQLYLHHGLPGVHSLWYAIQGSKFLFDTFKQRLKARLDPDGPKATIQRLESGPLYVFTKKGLARYKVPVQPCPAVQEHRTLDTAPAELLDLMITAAREMLAPWKDQTIVSLLSGGTDGALTTLALIKAGYKVHAVCVGSADTDFDPLWAALYAEEWGVPYTLVTIPHDQPTLEALLARTLLKVEVSDYSNVLMGMCSTLANDFAKELGSEVVVHGHFADDVIGNEMFTVGEYRKRIKADPRRDTSQEWATLRYDETMMLFPNTLQVDRVTRGDGLHWRSLFAHPDVLDYVLSCPNNVCVTAKDKPLYQRALDPFLSDASWRHTHKVGYYTGSGIGELRKSRPYLSDADMRTTLKQVLNEEYSNARAI